MKRIQTAFARWGWRARRAAAKRAFSLVELLVVIGLIAALAALVFAVRPGLEKNKSRKLVAAQMAQIVTALDRYHARMGFYPPWTNNPAVNPLYYELVSTFVSGNGLFWTRTPDGFHTNTLQELQASFNTAGFTFSGFLNSSQDQQPNFTDPDAVTIVGYLPGLRKRQIVEDRNRVRLLAVPVKGPIDDYCVWNYLSPGINNAESFDLWVDVWLKDKVERVGNWGSPR